MARSILFLYSLIVSTAWAQESPLPNAPDYFRLFSKVTVLISSARYFDAHALSLWGEEAYAANVHQKARFQLLDTVSLWKLGEVTEAYRKASDLANATELSRSEHDQASFFQRWIALKEELSIARPVGQLAVEERLEFYTELARNKKISSKKFRENPFLTPELQLEVARYVELDRYHAAIAGGLNGIVPGAGHLYLGQTQNALMVFLLNSIFIGASIEFFRKDLLFPGVASAAMASTSYLGGIVSAIRQTRTQNQKLEKPILEALEPKLFPELTIHP